MTVCRIRAISSYYESRGDQASPEEGCGEATGRPAHYNPHYSLEKPHVTFAFAVHISFIHVGIPRNPTINDGMEYADTIFTTVSSLRCVQSNFENNPCGLPHG